MFLCSSVLNGRVSPVLIEARWGKEVTSALGFGTIVFIVSTLLAIVSFLDVRLRGFLCIIFLIFSLFGLVLIMIEFLFARNLEADCKLLSKELSCQAAYHSMDELKTRAFEVGVCLMMQLRSVERVVGLDPDKRPQGKAIHFGNNNISIVKEARRKLSENTNLFLKFHLLENGGWEQYVGEAKRREIANARELAKENDTGLVVEQGNVLSGIGPDLPSGINTGRAGDSSE